MKRYLKPISEEHSIKKVVAEVYIPQSFLKPEDILEKIKQEIAYNHYSKKELMGATTIKIDNKGLGLLNEANKGFILEEYDDRGEVDYIFKLENIQDNRSKISLESRKYKDWTTFKNRLDTDLKNFLNIRDFYIQAINLNFRDEFIWTSKEENIKVEEIFNLDSDLISKRFLTSKNGTFLLVSQGDSEGGQLPFEEKVEVFFNNDMGRIIIDYQYVLVYQEIKQFNDFADKVFSSQFDIAHCKNKEILKDVLSEETQKLIKLI